MRREIRKVLARKAHAERARIMKYWTVDYTCCCGIYVHPEHPMVQARAKTPLDPEGRIRMAHHLTDCPFNPRAYFA